MQTLMELLLGIDAPSWTAGGSWRLEWLALPEGDEMLVLLAALVGATGGLWWLYRWEGQHLNRTMRAFLTLVRFSIILLVTLMLLEPVIVLSKDEFVPSHLLVLVDSSQSMALRDAWEDESRAIKVAQTLDINEGPDGLRQETRLDLTSRFLDSGFLEALSGEGDRIVHVHRFADRLDEDPLPGLFRPANTGSGGDRGNTAQKDPARRTESSANAVIEGIATEPIGDVTAIGSSLKQALLSYAGMPLAGILIISDGQSTSGEPVESAAKLAADEGVPVMTLAVGTPEGPRNAAVVKVEASPVAFVRDSNPLTVHIQSRGMKDTTCQLLVEYRINGGPWGELGREDLVLGLDGSAQQVTFDFSEQRPAKLEFRASLEDLGPELTKDDNTGHAETRVVRQRLHVLLVYGSTFPEVQFLRNSFMRDRGIELSTWNQAADSEYEHPGDTPINRLPVTQEEINDYDCVVLYDPNPDAWPINFPELLRNFVSRAGGGLVFIAGEMQTARLFDRQLEPQMSWLNMLPIVREPGLFRSEVQLKLSARQPWKLDVTDQGFTDPVFAFTEDEEANRRILEQLPGMFWHFPVTRAKPGARVLAVHGDPRMRNEFGPEVLLATQLVGPGRTMFIAFDSTYRWRYLNEQSFDGFWARVVDRAGRNKRLGGTYPFRLSTPRSTYEPGGFVKIVARFNNSDDVEPGLEELYGEVERGDDETIRLILSPDEQPGVFSGTFPANRPGTHFVRVWMGDPSAGSEVTAATLPVEVKVPDLEYAAPGLDRSTLETIATATGGQSFDVLDRDGLSNAFRIGRVGRQLEHRQEIWDAPVFFASIFVLLCVEWIVRKRVRLI